MTRTIRELGPLAVVTVVALGVVTWLLGTNPDVGRWLLAAVLAAHGWIHLLFLFPVPAPGESGAPAAWPFDLRMAWIVGRAGRPAVRALRGLAVVTMALSVLAAMAAAGLLIPEAWWAALAIAASVASAVLLSLAFSPTLLLGFVVDAFVVWLALAGPWRPGSA